VPRLADATKQTIASAAADLVEGRVHTLGELQRCVQLLELAPYRDRRAALEPTRIAGVLAAQLGDEYVQTQVMLIHADLLASEGNTAEAGRLLFAKAEWITASGNLHLQARHHHQLSLFYRLLGDIPSSHEHALHALEHAPADTRPELRAQYQLAVAVALSLSGDVLEANQRYHEVVEAGLRNDDPRVSINALNNMAYLLMEQGLLAEATDLVTRMLQITDEYGTTPLASDQHTIAKVRLALGFPEAALEIAAQVATLAPDAPEADPEGIVYCMLVEVEAERALGRFARAQAALDRVFKACEGQNQQMIEVLAQLEQAQLYAAEHRYQEAYEQHRAFHRASEAHRSAEREARARILHIALGAQEARRDSAHYRELALRDPLTGLFNRRFVNDHLAELVARCARTQGHLSVAMFDLDHFKRINDTYSHEAGDAVLVAFATLLSELAEEPAVAARLGGEEFLVILPGTDGPQARTWATRALDRIRAHDWTLVAGDLPVRVSVGLCSAKGAGWSRERLLQTADQNLYAAKRSGRDRFVGP